MFWQLTVDANDPARLARFWAQALGYTPVPPPGSTSWHRHYRDGLGDASAYENRLFDPDGTRPPLWFQPVPEDKAAKNRVHLDLYPTGRDDTLSQSRRVELVEAMVANLVAEGASVQHRERDDDPSDPVYYVVMHDPEGNEFCIS